MATLITIIHVFACFFLILVVLLQAGKGGGMGIAFGSSTSAQVFGGRGAGSFLEKLTAGTAIVFMCTSITLAYLSGQTDSSGRQKKSAAQQWAQRGAAKKAGDEKAQKEAVERARGLSSTPPVAPAATPPSSPPPGAKTEAPAKAEAPA